MSGLNSLDGRDDQTRFKKEKKKKNPQYPVICWINRIENRKRREKSWFFFFLKINKTNKPLARLMRKKENTQTTRIRNERGSTTNLMGKKMVIKESYK